MARRRARRAVVSFASTHAALACEAACQEAGVAGRIIPTPVSIRADCGLAWSMPPEARPDFEVLTRARSLDFDGIYDLEL